MDCWSLIVHWLLLFLLLNECPSWFPITTIKVENEVFGVYWRHLVIRQTQQSWRGNGTPLEHGTQSHAGLLQMIFPMSIPDDFKLNRLLMFTWNPKEPFINVCFNWMMNQIITSKMAGNHHFHPFISWLALGFIFRGVSWTTSNINNLRHVKNPVLIQPHWCPPPVFPWLQIIRFDAQKCEKRMEFLSSLLVVQEPLIGRNKCLGNTWF